MFCFIFVVNFKEGENARLVKCLFSSCCVVLCRIVLCCVVLGWIVLCKMISMSTTTTQPPASISL